MVKLLFAAGVLLCSFDSLALELNALELQGKQIYTSGVSPFGNSINALVGESSVSIPASAMPCLGCHGQDGLGRPEGGVIPSNIRWNNLSKSYGGKSSLGRRYPAYSPDDFFTAVTRGIDSGGNKLDTNMPRYTLQKNETEALVAYLKRIQLELDPGIKEDSITVASILPKISTLQGLGNAIESVINAYFSDINKTDGIFGRKLQLETHWAQSEDDILSQEKKLLDSESVFSLLTPFSAGLDAQFSEIVEAYKIPSIGPFTRYPDANNKLQRYTFYLFGGQPLQNKALVQYAISKNRESKNSLSIVFPKAKQDQLPIREAIQQLGKVRKESSLLYAYQQSKFPTQEDIDKLKSKQSIIFLGEQSELIRLIELANKSKWYPNIYFSGATVDQNIFNIPDSFYNKIFLAYPLLMSGHNKQGMTQFIRFHQRHQLKRIHIAAQMYAYTSVSLLVEALKLSGKALSRDKFIKSLESLTSFKTGLVPPLSFGPDKRVGANGIYLLSISKSKKSLKAIDEWFKLD